MLHHARQRAALSACLSLPSDSVPPEAISVQWHLLRQYIQLVAEQLIAPICIVVKILIISRFFLVVAGQLQSCIARPDRFTEH